ncbi:MAG: Crp/Fnr family transcriptional regulator [Myxococcales bacterium]|nr:Crp/Fnr family transcriptional regulator [Myxococcales bacterium]
MALHLQRARAGKDLDEVFRLRHEILVGLQRALPGRPSGRVFDRFDAFAETENFVARIGGSIVGSIRATAMNPVGTPLGDLSRYRAALGEDAAPMATSLLCIAASHRSMFELPVSLLGLATYWANARGATHVVAGVPVEYVSLFTNHNWAPLDGPITTALGLSVIPLALALARAGDRFLEFLRQAHAQPFIESFERMVYATGEIILERGDPGENAFVLLSGSIGVYAEYGGVSGASRRVSAIHPGEVFGELALLADIPRTATLVAESPVDVMMLPRTQFERQVAASPERALFLCRLLARRLTERISMSAEAPATTRAPKEG